MSVEINWKTLTEGPDGAALAETIRSFIHDRFQAIPLPKLIRSVKVHGFEFGDVAPRVVLKDICDPLPEFYSTDDDDHDDGEPDSETPIQGEKQTRGHDHLNDARQNTFGGNPRTNTDLSARLNSPPGFLGGTTHLGYFHLPLANGLPGAQTPLAAVAGAHFNATPGIGHGFTHHHHASSYDSVTPPSTSLSASLKEAGVHDRATSSAVVDDEDLDHDDAHCHNSDGFAHSAPESSPEDLQVVFHIDYAGDVKLAMTAEVFLDYPMPSFVGIPLKLRITGLTFNGVGIVAYIKRKAHVCFLNPEDADALVGDTMGVDLTDSDVDDPDAEPEIQRTGALLEDIRIETEMGESDSGKQVLKNVDKIEKFILEQVQRIFEDEFVYPSYWTFLV